MIFADSVTHALPLALIAGKKGLQINPVPGTPLAELVRATNSTVDVSCGTGNVLDNEFSSLLGCNIETLTSGGDIITTHDGIVDSFITDIATAVKQHISFAKNVVKPIVVDMAEKTIEFLKEQPDPAAEMQVVVKSFPKPMTNAGFETSINKYDGVANITPDIQITGGEMTGAALLELMKTGSKDFDSDIGEWFVNYGEVNACLLWDNLFRKPGDVKTETVFGFDEIRTANSVDDFLAIHLLARKLYDEVPENIAMENKVFKNAVAQYRDWSGAALFAHYAKYNSSIKLKTLVVGLDDRAKKITVNEPVYKAWLETGGNNEVLLGLLISGQLVFAQSLIDDRKEEFLSKWNTYLAFKRTASKNQVFNQFKDVLTIVFADEMKSFREEEQEFVNSNPDYTTSVTRKFKEQIDSLIFKDMEDVYSTCLKLVCRARFFYTDAEDILVGINEAVAANPKIDIREAALLSTIEYVCDYVCNQLTFAQ
jgi:hypothetical protein